MWCEAPQNSIPTVAQGNNQQNPLNLNQTDSRALVPFLDLARLKLVRPKVAPKVPVQYQKTAATAQWRRNQRWGIFFTPAGR